jgi:hypothetical protein
VKILPVAFFRELVPTYDCLLRLKVVQKVACDPKNFPNAGYGVYVYWRKSTEPRKAGTEI